MTIHVNSDILIWARQSAGFDVEEAARKSGFTNSSRSSAAEKLAALEAGEKQPTRSQLAKFAKVYKRPLINFYLAEPPKTGSVVKTSAKHPMPEGNATTECSTRFCGM